MAMPTKPCMVMLRTGVDGDATKTTEPCGLWGARVSGVWCRCVRASLVSASLTSQTQSTQESASQRDGLYDNFTVG